MSENQPQTKEKWESVTVADGSHSRTGVEQNQSQGRDEPYLVTLSGPIYLASGTDTCTRLGSTH